MSQDTCAQEHCILSASRRSCHNMEMGASHSQIRMQAAVAMLDGPKADEQEGIPVGEDHRVWFWRKPWRDHEDA